MTNTSQMIEQVAEAMWLRTHPDGIWPADAEKEFGAAGRGISTATIYRQDAGAAVETIGRYIGEVFGQQPSATTEDEAASAQLPMFNDTPPPQPAPQDWRAKRGL